MKRIEDLYCDNILVKPIDADWSELSFSFERGEDGGYSYSEANRCEGDHTLQQVVDYCLDQDIEYEDVDISDLDQFIVSCESECPLCDGELYPEGPMMNYWYPIDLNDYSEEEAAKLIVDLPLCVVNVAGQTGLALTGGGMDLSWEICEAFITLDQLPPVHFAGNLPRMSGWEKSWQKKRVLEAAVRSAEVARNWVENDVNRATQMLKEWNGQ